MIDKNMTQEQLIHELATLRQKMSEMEKIEAERKRAEKEYQTIISTAMDGFWIADMQGNFLDVNEAYCRLIGYSRDELLKMRISDIEAIENPEETAQRIRKIRETGGDRFETRHRCKDSRIVDVEVSVNYRMEMDRMFVFLRDITGRKRVEEELRKREEEARKLARENAIFAEVGRIISSTLNIEAVYERFAKETRKLIPFDRLGISIIDYENKTLYVPYFAGLEVLGLKPGYIIPLAGSSAEKVMRDRSSILIGEKNREEAKKQTPSLLPYFKAGLQSVMVIPLFSKDQVIGILYFFCTKSDAYTETDLKLAEGISTQIAGAIANAQLFNQLNRVMEALGESEERYRNILANIEDGYYEVDLPGNFTFFNDSLCRILGYSKEEMMGMNNRQYADKENAKKLYQIFVGVYQTGQPSRISGWEIIRKDGMKRYHESSISLIKDSSGNRIGFRGIVRDITERKQAEKEREKLIQDLQKALSEVKKLSGFLPICASCKKIRDDKGYWNQIEAYIHDHSEAQFSHGICPDCKKKLYGDFFEEENISRKQ